MLLGGNTNVNSVVRRTGIYKTTVFKTIDHLIDAGLVTKQDDPDHEQRMIVKLTPIGSELAAYLYNLEEFYYFHCDLWNTLLPHIKEIASWRNVEFSTENSEKLERLFVLKMSSKYALFLLIFGSNDLAKNILVLNFEEFLLLPYTEAQADKEDVIDKLMAELPIFSIPPPTETSGVKKGKDLINLIYSVISPTGKRL